MSVLLLLLAAAAGCRTLPHPDVPPADLPPAPAWSAPAVPGAVPEAQWWESFGSAPLAEAVERAIAENRDLRAAAARVEAALARARIAGADRRPALDAALGRARQEQVFVGLPFPGADPASSTSTEWRATLDASWELDLWGRLAAAAEAAGAEAEASAADLAAARHSIAARTARAWVVWRERALQEALARETAASHARTAELVAGRFERGRGSALDVRLARASAESAAALAAERAAAAERAVRELEVLLGRYPGGNAPRDPDTALPDVPPPPPSGLPAELLRRRPDLAAREARIAASDARLYEARAARWPRVALTGSAGRTGAEPGDLSDPDFGIWSFALSLTQPLYAGGRLAGGVDLAEAELEEALASYASAVLTAWAEAEAALDVEAELAEREERLVGAAEEAARALELAEDRYARGLEPVLSVLESQRRALDARSQLLAARRARLETRIDLHLALGGGFGPAPGTLPETRP